MLDIFLFGIAARFLAYLGAIYGYLRINGSSTSMTEAIIKEQSMLLVRCSEDEGNYKYDTFLFIYFVVLANYYSIEPIDSYL